jgi:hypothetical protein
MAGPGPLAGPHPGDLLPHALAGPGGREHRHPAGAGERVRRAHLGGTLPALAGRFPATTADPLGDGVAETLMLRDSASAVRHQTPPDQDVYVGIELSPTCAARTSAELTRPTTGSPSCDSFAGPPGQEGAGSVDQDTT